MANKSSTMFYCGFCDMTLAKSEGVVYDTIHYCNDVCRKLGKKTSVKDGSMKELRENVEMLRRLKSLPQTKKAQTLIKQHCKGAYKDLEIDYKKWLLVGNPDHDLNMFKHALCLYGHIHNGHKDKALKALARFNDWTAETFEKMCVDSTAYSSEIIYEDDEEEVSGEENIRVSGIIYKLEREKFKLMVELM